MYGQKTHLRYKWIVKYDFELSMDSQKWFTLSLDNSINYVWRNYYSWTIILHVCAKNTDYRLKTPLSVKYLTNSTN